MAQATSGGVYAKRLMANCNHLKKPVWQMTPGPQSIRFESVFQVTHASLPLELTPLCSGAGQVTDRLTQYSVGR